ncbi:Protein phosphatase 2C 2 [Ascosphaera acerosa]|nr:Protein phosphatase 2C 2 [Ascosphaera acerosa]
MAGKRAAPGSDTTTVSGASSMNGGQTAKRAYRQRRKDPSYSSSCTECANRNMKCLFTKETNRRMSSIKQVQDLERQLAQTKQQLTRLRSAVAVLILCPAFFVRRRKTSSDGGDECVIFGVSAMQGWRISMEDAHTAILDMQAAAAAAAAAKSSSSGSTAKSIAAANGVSKAAANATVTPSPPVHPTDPSERMSFFGVFDGHGGEKVALFAGENVHRIVAAQDAFRKGDIEAALRKGFLETDSAILRDPKYEEEVSGCTASCAIVCRDRIICANAGDSRTVLGIKGRAKPLSFDHKPQNEGERARITAAGGFVDYGRVNGNLALSRALGDFEFKKSPDLKAEQQVVTSYPDVTTHRLSEDDEFLVLACDGIWDCQSSQAVIEFVRRGIAARQELHHICENMMDTCLASSCETGGVGCDNMTMMIVGLLNGKTKEEWYDMIATRVANGEGPCAPPEYGMSKSPVQSAIKEEEEEEKTRKKEEEERERRGVAVKREPDADDDVAMTDVDGPVVASLPPPLSSPAATAAATATAATHQHQHQHQHHRQNHLPLLPPPTTEFRGPGVHHSLDEYDPDTAGEDGPHGLRIGGAAAAAGDGIATNNNSGIVSAASIVASHGLSNLARSGRIILLGDGTEVLTDLAGVTGSGGGHVEEGDVDADEKRRAGDADAVSDLDEIAKQEEQVKREDGQADGPADVKAAGQEQVKVGDADADADAQAKVKAEPEPEPDSATVKVKVEADEPSQPSTSREAGSGDDDDDGDVKRVRDAASATPNGQS